MKACDGCYWFNKWYLRLIGLNLSNDLILIKFKLTLCKDVNSTLSIFSFQRCRTNEVKLKNIKLKCRPFFSFKKKLKRFQADINMNFLDPRSQYEPHIVSTTALINTYSTTSGSNFQDPGSNLLSQPSHEQIYRNYWISQHGAWIRRSDSRHHIAHQLFTTSCVIFFFNVFRVIKIQVLSTVI